MSTEKEKILDMLKSPDSELRTLGMLAAEQKGWEWCVENAPSAIVPTMNSIQLKEFIYYCIDKGQNWCFENLPYYGYQNDPYSGIKVNDTACDSIMYKRDDLCILIRVGYLHCREYKRFPHRAKYKIIEV